MLVPIPHAPLIPGDVHFYLSTACLHGLHEKCGVKQLARGELGAPHCKYCEAVCVCSVCDHVGQAAREGGGSA